MTIIHSAPCPSSADLLSLCSRHKLQEKLLLAPNCGAAVSISLCDEGQELVMLSLSSFGKALEWFCWQNNKVNRHSQKKTPSVEVAGGKLTFSSNKNSFLSSNYEFPFKKHHFTDKDFPESQ
uniref:Uncharacterized protein n=1 Tax=Nothobranchius furzeri TaxID=105023 RepID=A0A1A8B8V3_NOTFU